MVCKSPHPLHPFFSFPSSRIGSRRLVHTLYPPIHRQTSSQCGPQTTIPIRKSAAIPKILSYKAPTSGLISRFPASWIPYAELARLDKPTGTYYLFFPCLFSTLMAAFYTHAPPLAVLETSALFFTGALIMRGAGCTINDLWDRNLDPYVTRTKLSPGR